MTWDLKLKVLKILDNNLNAQVFRLYISPAFMEPNLRLKLDVVYDFFAFVFIGRN